MGASPLLWPNSRQTGHAAFETCACQAKVKVLVDCLLGPDLTAPMASNTILARPARSRTLPFCLGSLAAIAMMTVLLRLEQLARR